MDVDVEIVTGAAGVLADETSLVGLVNGLLKMARLLVELSADVDVSSGGVHGAASNETAFNQFVGVASHDFAVLASTRFTFVSIDDEVTGTVCQISESVSRRGVSQMRTEDPSPTQACS